MNKQELLTYISGLCLTDLRPSMLDQDQFFCFSTPGAHAEANWRLLREHVEHTFHGPVVIGADDPHGGTRVLEWVCLRARHRRPRLRITERTGAEHREH